MSLPCFTPAVVRVSARMHASCVRAQPPDAAACVEQPAARFEKVGLVTGAPRPRAPGCSASSSHCHITICRPKRAPLGPLIRGSGRLLEPKQDGERGCQDRRLGPLRSSTFCPRSCFHVRASLRDCRDPRERETDTEQGRSRRKRGEGRLLQARGSTVTRVYCKDVASPARREVLL